MTLRNLVQGLTQDGRGLAGSHGSIDLQHVGRNRYRVALRRSWASLGEAAALRRTVAELIVENLMERAKAAQTDDQKSKSDCLVEFSINELTDAIRRDIFLHARVQKPLAVIDRALLFLHEHKVITMQNGLAVFRQAMTIRLNPHDTRRTYKAGDYKPLALHYRERRLQIHVIVEYANLAIEKVARAIGLVLDYFAMPRGDFIKKYFSGRQKILERATSMESYRQIVESLNHPVQIAIVGAPVHSSQLVLAGPGAGKTRVVVHRCAYLLRVERVQARRILVMCFNHNAAVSLRKRLFSLMGEDARGVTIVTYHGAAMRLAGISLRALMEENENPDFDSLIRDAVALLKGEKEIYGIDPYEMREHLLQGFSHILVDEYQDIDQDQYDLVSAIAGRSLEESDDKLAIMAVGDDDQNIYAFRGANVDFIRQFKKDYQCGSVYLVENYRSSANIIEASNRLISRNKDRMKDTHKIRINRHRKTDPAGGSWHLRDPLSQGQVQRLAVDDLSHQASAVFDELTRLKSLHPTADWANFAVLGRTRKTLDLVRACLEAENIPVRVGLETGLPLHRIREVHQFLSELKQIEKQICKASALARYLPDAGNDWATMLESWHSQYQLETADTELPVSLFIDWLYESIAEQRREKSLGQGVFLSTVHGAKGLEFENVFILDGDWRRASDAKNREEDRRLLYVGMTRAKAMLCLMETRNQPNPFLKDVDGEQILKRSVAHPAFSTSLPRRYCLLTLAELHLSYAGGFAKGDFIHTQLARLAPGDRLHPMPSKSTISLHTPAGNCVARLSAKGAAKWSERLNEIKEMRVIGMVRWSADTSPPEYRPYLKSEIWEVPLIEMTIRARDRTHGVLPESL